MHSQLVARGAEQEAPERRIGTKLIAALDQREERVLHEVIGSRGHLGPEEPEQGPVVPLDQHAAAGLVAAGPAVQQLRVGRHWGDDSSDGRGVQRRSESEDSG